jgi:hypothetical protein
MLNLVMLRGSVDPWQAHQWFEKAAETGHTSTT